MKHVSNVYDDTINENVTPAEALEWALETVERFAKGVWPPDDPDWNNFRDAQFVLAGLKEKEAA